MPECGGVRPWEMERFTEPELAALNETLKALEKQARDMQQRVSRG